MVTCLCSVWFVRPFVPSHSSMSALTPLPSSSSVPSSSSSSSSPSSVQSQLVRLLTSASHHEWIELQPILPSLISLAPLPILHTLIDKVKHRRQWRTCPLDWLAAAFDYLDLKSLTTAARHVNKHWKHASEHPTAWASRFVPLIKLLPAVRRRSESQSTERLGEWRPPSSMPLVKNLLIQNCGDSLNAMTDEEIRSLFQVFPAVSNIRIRRLQYVRGDEVANWIATGTTNLQSVTIDHWAGLSDAGLSMLCQLPRLSSLCIKRCRKLTSDCLSLLGRLPPGVLTKLELDARLLFPDGRVNSLKSLLPGAGRLKELVLSTDSLYCNSLQLEFICTHFHQLRRLRVVMDYRHTSESLFSICKLTHLTSLQLYYGKWTDQLLSSLCSSCPSLTYLSLCSDVSSLSISGVRLLLTRLPHLSLLDLRDHKQLPAVLRFRWMPLSIILKRSPSDSEWDPDDADLDEDDHEEENEKKTGSESQAASGCNNRQSNPMTIEKRLAFLEKPFTELAAALKAAEDEIKSKAQR